MGSTQSLPQSLDSQWGGASQRISLNDTGLTAVALIPSVTSACSVVRDNSVLLLVVPVAQGRARSCLVVFVVPRDLFSRGTTYGDAARKNKHE